MQQCESLRLKTLLVQAGELYAAGRYQLSRDKLLELKTSHPAIELNLLLIELKENTKGSNSLLQKMMDKLTGINIEIFKSRPECKAPKPGNKPSNPITSIQHELYFWNIIVLAQLLGREEVAQLVAVEAMEYYKSMRTETALMVVYQLLRVLTNQNRLASCVSLVQKNHQLVNHIKKISKTEAQYRVLNQMLMTRVFLKLNMLDSAIFTYQMKVNGSQEDEEYFKENTTNTNTNSFATTHTLPYKYYQEFLHAEIDFHSKEFNQSIKILAELTADSEQLKPKEKEKVRAMVDCNVGTILALNGQKTIAKVLLQKSYKEIAHCSDEKEKEKDKDATTKDTLLRDNQKLSNLSRIKQNILLVGLLDKSSDILACKQQFDSLSTSGRSYSCKLNYRKAQVCLNYYHSVLKANEKILSYSDIHDQYEPTYYYPNQPYFQQKGKNKNPNFTNGKHFHRRYVLTQWEPTTTNNQVVIQDTDDPELEARELKEIKPAEKEKDKLINIGKGKKNRDKKEDEDEKPKVEPKEAQTANSESKKDKNQTKALLRSVLEQAENNLRQSLLILEEEKKMTAKVYGPEGDMTHIVNEKLYSQYVQFKSSILALLCYVLLCRSEWSKVISTASQFAQFEKVHLQEGRGKTVQQRQTAYQIHSYKMEALCELNRIQDAYESMHSAISLGCQQDQKIEARSTINPTPGEVYFQQTNQYNCLLYNISVLHSRDNRIPESHQSIQKMLSHMRLVPSNSQAKIPQSLIDLLIHYNLRTYNIPSAIQMIKRKRILSLQGLVVHGVYPTLSITK